MGPNGLRAGWRLSIYIVIAIAIGFVVLTPMSLFFARHKGVLGQGLSPTALIVYEGALAFIVLLAAWIMSKIEKRPFGEYGTPQNQALGKRFWQGMLWGLAMVSALIGLIAAVGAYSFGPIALGSKDILINGILWLIGFGVVGVFEEYSFRGYTLYTLASGIGFWPAATLLSAGFGATHLRNPGEGLVGGLSVFVIAMFFCFTLRRTGNLWFAIGLHCSFDWGETFLYSVPNSGMVVTKCLSLATLHGPKWITGGTIGPEGSVFCFLIVALVFLLFHRFYPAKHA
jgi:membrane protease YdiL (CAAX protease family)